MSYQQRMLSELLRRLGKERCGLRIDIFMTNPFHCIN